MDTKTLAQNILYGQYTQEPSSLRILAKEVLSLYDRVREQKSIIRDLEEELDGDYFEDDLEWLDEDEYIDECGPDCHCN